MKVIIWNDKTYREIPIHPQDGESCLIICKQPDVKFPKTNTGSWEVLEWKQDELNKPNWAVHFVGLFWKIKDAELFAETYAKKIKTVKNIATIIESTDFQNRLKAAIECGVDSDWYWDGQDENRIDTFNPDDATRYVTELLHESLL